MQSWREVWKPDQRREARRGECSQDVPSALWQLFQEVMLRGSAVQAVLLDQTGCCDRTIRTMAVPVTDVASCSPEIVLEIVSPFLSKKEVRLEFNDTALQMSFRVRRTSQPASCLYTRTLLRWMVKWQRLLSSVQKRPWPCGTSTEPPQWHVCSIHGTHIPVDDGAKLVVDYMSCGIEYITGASGTLPFISFAHPPLHVTWNILICQLRTFQLARTSTESLGANITRGYQDHACHNRSCVDWRCDIRHHPWTS